MYKIIGKIVVVVLLRFFSSNFREWLVFFHSSIESRLLVAAMGVGPATKESKRTLALLNPPRFWGALRSPETCQKP